MHLSIHLNFQGNCAEAFAFYKSVFGDNGAFLMKYSDAPAGAPVEPDWMDKVMHTALPLGDGMLMGCDAVPGSSKPIGGFQVSVSMTDAAEVKRIYEALAAGGSVEMPLAPTFWSPAFGMCTDKFGVGWMVSVPGSTNA